MEPHGEGGMRILIVAEAPGEEEDRAGIPLVGKAGKFLRKRMARTGVDLDADVTKINIVQCRPPGNRTPAREEIAACRPRVERQIKGASPDLILAFGGPAIAELLSEAPFTPGAALMHGRVVPSDRWGCWVACGFHPSFYLHADHKHDRRMDDFLEGAIGWLAERGPYEPGQFALDPNSYTILEDLDEAVRFLEDARDSSTPCAFDYETSCLSPWDPKAKFLLASFATTPERGVCIPLAHPHARWSAAELDTIYRTLADWLRSDCPKVIQNWAFEEVWSRVHLGTGIANVVKDTMVCEHVLDNRKGVTGQAFQEFVRYGVRRKEFMDRTNLSREFLDTVARYGCLDVRYDIKWHHDQEGEMTDDDRAAYSLFHGTIPVFAECRMNGIRVDAGRLSDLRKDIEGELAGIADARKGEWVRRYEKEHGAFDASKPDARRRMLYDVMELDPLKRTQSGNAYAVDRESLDHAAAQVGERSEARALIDGFRGEGHLVKLRGYIDGWGALSKADGYLHPEFKLNIVDSYRSSSADPNFQNVPVRNPLLARIRRSLVPRFDLLGEIDFSGAEIRMLATASGDRNLIRYLNDDIDYHRKYAALLYGKPEDEISKAERHKGKNQFVFPEFYGSYWRNIAAAVPDWQEGRVREVEDEFWRDLAGVRRWQERQWESYLRHGYLRYLTGFRPRFGREGMLNRKQCGNFPIQGASFHRLLMVMIAVRQWLKGAGMRSRLIGQIHDSIVLDLAEDEIPAIAAEADRIIAEPQWEWDTKVKWKAEFKVGPNMLDMEEIG